MLNYLKILNHYKYHGVLLLEKLIAIIKSISMVDLDIILIINKKSFNEKNKFMVYDYSLKLIKLYDDICEYVKYRQAIYESNKKKDLYKEKN